MIFNLIICGEKKVSSGSKAPNNATELTTKNVLNYLGASATFNKAGTTSMSDMAIVTVSSNGTNEFYDVVV